MGRVGNVGSSGGAAPGFLRISGSGVAGARWSLWSWQTGEARLCREPRVDGIPENPCQVVRLGFILGRRSGVCKITFLQCLRAKRNPTLRLLWCRGGVSSCPLLPQRLDCCFPTLQTLWEH